MIIFNSLHLKCAPWYYSNAGNEISDVAFIFLRLGSLAAYDIRILLPRKKRQQTLARARMHNGLLRDAANAHVKSNLSLSRVARNKQCAL